MSAHLEEIECLLQQLEEEPCPLRALLPHFDQRLVVYVADDGEHAHEDLALLSGSQRIEGGEFV